MDETKSAAKRSELAEADRPNVADVPAGWCMHTFVEFVDESLGNLNTLTLLHCRNLHTAVSLHSLAQQVYLIGNLLAGRAHFRRRHEAHGQHCGKERCQGGTRNDAKCFFSVAQQVPRD